MSLHPEHTYVHLAPDGAATQLDGDGFYLLSGALDLLLEQDGGVVTAKLEGAGAAVVPRGVWHTAKLRAPSRVLHVTRGAGTQTRPA